MQGRIFFCAVLRYGDVRLWHGPMSSAAGMRDAPLDLSKFRKRLKPNPSRAWIWPLIKIAIPLAHIPQQPAACILEKATNRRLTHAQPLRRNGATLALCLYLGGSEFCWGE